MSNFFKISILIILFFLNFASFASEIKVTAKAKVNYNNEFSEDIKDEALILAKKAALKKATKKFKKDKLTLIKRLKDEFYESYDDFILDVSIQREKHNEKSKSFRVSIKATISKEAIEAFLNENNEIADGGADVNFGLVSIVSRTTSTKIYDDKKVKIRSNEGQKVNEERAASSGDSAIVSQSSKSMTVSKSGGSTEKKADKNTWVFDPDLSMEMEGFFGEDLVSAGFEPQDFLELDLSELEIEDFEDMEQFVSKKGRLRGKIIKAMRNSAFEAEWNYFGYGTFQFFMPNKRQGLYFVDGYSEFRIWKITDEGKAKSVCKTKKYSFVGEGETGEVAINDALTGASKKVMEVCLPQIQKKGLD